MRRRHGSSTPTEDSHAVKPRSRAHARNWRSRSSQPGPGSGSYELIDLGLGDKPIGQSKPPRACLDTATPMRIIALTSSCFEILKQLLWPDRQGNLSHSFTVPDQRKHLPARRLRGPSTGFAEGVSMSAQRPRVQLRWVERKRCPRQLQCVVRPRQRARRRSALSDPGW